MLKKTIIPLLLTLVLSTFCYADEPTVTVDLAKSSFPVDQGVLLTVTVTGSRSAELIMPEVDGLTFHSRGTSSMVNIINGDVTSSSSTTFVVQAEREGNYTVPPIVAEIKGRTYKSEPFTLSVYGKKTAIKGKAVSSGKNLEEIAFLEVKLTGPHYVGEQVPVTIRGYFDDRYKISLESPPTLTGEGVIMAPFTKQPTQSRERLAGRTYDVVDWQTTLSAIKEGEHTIELSLGAAVYTREKFDNPFNDPFFDSFFSNTRKTPLKVKSPPLTFKALPLPTENQPEGFTGAVGKFTIDISADPIIVDVGEPITVTTTITGEGNFDSVHAPTYIDSADWKTYKPSNLEVKPEEKEKKKVFQQVIIPKNDSLTEIPPLSFSYFNPEEKKYEISKSKPVAIHVKPVQTTTIQPQKKLTEPDNSTAEATSSKPAENQRSYTNLLPQHLETGGFSSRIEPLFKRDWFILACIACLLVIFAATLFHLFTFFKGNDLEKERSKKQQKLARKYIKELTQLSKTGDSRTFLSTARQYVQEFYCLEFNLEPKAITASTLASKGLQQSSAYMILQAADSADFAGKDLSSAEMNQLLEQLQKEISK